MKEERREERNMKGGIVDTAVTEVQSINSFIYMYTCTIYIYMYMYMYMDKMQSNMSQSTCTCTRVHIRTTDYTVSE